MFILRCVFWLTIGFLVVAPHGTNFAASASQVRDQALAAGMQAGEQLLVSQAMASSAVPRAVMARLSPPTPSVDLPMQDSSTAAVVFPRPRPAAMG